MNLQHAKILAVITDTVSWADFQALAKVIEDQAHACDYSVIFFNLKGEDDRLQRMLDQIQANGYLISRKIFLRTKGKEIMALQKPFALMEEHFLCAVTKEGTFVPKQIRNRTIAAVKYVCL